MDVEPLKSTMASAAGPSRHLPMQKPPTLRGGSTALLGSVVNKRDAVPRERTNGGAGSGATAAAGANQKNAPLTLCACAVMPGGRPRSTVLGAPFSVRFLAQRPQWRLQDKYMDCVWGNHSKAWFLPCAGPWGLLEMGTGRDLHIVCPLDQKVAQIFKNMDYGYYRLRNHTSIFGTDSAIQKGLILGARPACLEEHCVVAEEMLCIIDYSLILLLLHDCEIPFSLPNELLGLNSLTVFLCR